MKAQNRPGVIRLLLYILGAASLAGGMAGWVHASGGLTWALELNVPSWSPKPGWVNVFGAVSLQLTGLSLWILQRNGRDGLRLLCTALVSGLLGAIILHFIVFFGARDVTTGFLISLALWVFALITTGLVGRCSQPSGFLLWPIFLALTYGLVLSFEVMRLNTGSTFAGAF